MQPLQKKRKKKINWLHHYTGISSQFVQLRLVSVCSQAPKQMVVDKPFSTGQQHKTPVVVKLCLKYSEVPAMDSLCCVLLFTLPWTMITKDESTTVLYQLLISSCCSVYYVYQIHNFLGSLGTDKYAIKFEII